MLEVKMFNLSIGGAVARFMIMTFGAILIGLFASMNLAIVWTMVLAMSCIMAVSVRFGVDKKVA